ncbi:uncharacterized protein LOC124283051 [Haliotis rubra]|uniref:uncharacterized protein LOC124283051 n=1 Tax=Haliotis rubra TaxID=36100 RepID=UPI001EE61579|nr:uncharacterized protein LOC124283051 [Haliotis rubra]
MFLFGVLLLAASAYGQGSIQHCIHTNAEQLSADVVIGKVMNDMDTNKDQYISDLELLIEFVGRFDSNADSMITREEFIPKWHEYYKDVPEFAEYLFDHFDRTNDGFLGLYDVPGLKALVDLDTDGRVSEVEFTIYMTHLYQDCVPHSHKDPTA